MTSPSSLSYIAAREHISDLTRSAEQHRLAGSASEQERNSDRGSLLDWIAWMASRPRRKARTPSPAPAVAPPHCSEP
jgi:hypothetical protein